MSEGLTRLVYVEGQKILHLPAKLRMIPGEKLILHGRRSISASCKALELECRDEDFQKTDFFRSLKNPGKDPDSGHLARPARV